MTLKETDKSRDAYLRGYYAGFNARPEIKADWVSVDDELPEEPGTYLIAWLPTKYTLPKSMKHFYALSDYDPCDGWDESKEMSECKDYVVLAWTSLPAEYEDEEDD